MILDLTDDRRVNKPWLPQDDRDVTNGLIVEVKGYPACRTHGAMNRIDPKERIYRCSECSVGARLIPPTRRPRYAVHGHADALVREIGHTAARKVARWIRQARPEQRLYLDDYLLEVLDDVVEKATGGAA